MAVTTQYSSEYDASQISETRNLNTDEQHGRVRVAYFKHTQSGAGDATSSAAIVRLPAGRVRLLARNSDAYVNWTTASATLDVGYDAYTDIDGTAVAASVDGIDNGVSVDTAGFQSLGSGLTATGGTKVFESPNGVVIRVSSTDTAIADGDIITGALLYVVD